jgi:hypothetical protein
VLTAGTDAGVGSNAFLSFLPESHLAISLNGTAVDSQYDQLNIIGQVILTGLNLDLGGTYAPSIGDKFTIVNNDGDDDIIGEFNNLPDGQPFHIDSGALAGDYVISYHGGDGNDVVITAINFEPSLHPISDPPAIDEDAGLQQISLTGILPGYGHSILHVTVHSSNPSLIPDPEVTFSAADGTGIFTYKPAADQFGTAVITVTVQDDGGTADSRGDTVTQTFTVTVKPVNDPPNFTLHTPSDCSIADENPATHGPALPQVCHGVVQNIVAGPPNESDQTLTISISTDNDGLFTPTGGPKFDLAGDLTFTRMPNTSGLVTLTIVLTDSGGASASQQLTLNCIKPHKQHNSANSGGRNGRDVTGSTTTVPDGFIVAADVLAVINYINAHGSGPIVPAVNAPPYVDVDADDQVVANDALTIINWINAHPGQSEGPNADQPTSGTSVAEAADLMSLLATDLVAAQVKRRRGTG